MQSICWGCAEEEECGALITAGFGLRPLALSPPGHCHPLGLITPLALTPHGIVTPWHRGLMALLPLGIFAPLALSPPWRCRPLALSPLGFLALSPSWLCGPIGIVTPLALSPLGFVAPWHCHPLALWLLGIVTPLALSPLGSVTPWHCHPSFNIHHHHGRSFWLRFWGFGRGITKPPDPWRARRGCSSSNHPRNGRGVSDICFVSARRSGAGAGPTRWKRLKHYRAWPDNKSSRFIYDGWTLSRSLARSPRAVRSNPSLWIFPLPISPGCLLFFVPALPGDLGSEQTARHPCGSCLRG